MNTILTRHVTNQRDEKGRVTLQDAGHGLTLMETHVEVSVNGRRRHQVSRVSLGKNDLVMLKMMVERQLDEIKKVKLAS